MRLYLDIDGAITAHPDSYPDLRVVEVGGALIEYHPAKLHELLEPFDEVVWATSWIGVPDLLREVESALCIGPFDMVDLVDYEYQPPRTCGKLDAVRAHYEASPAEFTWIDDHLGLDDSRWAYEQGGRIVRPYYQLGGIYSIMDVDQYWRHQR